MVTLDIVSEQIDGVTLVSATGEMDFHNFGLLKTSVESALADGKKKFILDLSAVAYLDSSALGSLLYNQKRIQESRGDLVIVASTALNDILNLTHLDSYFTRVPTVDDAKDWLENRRENSASVIRLDSHRG